MSNDQPSKPVQRFSRYSRASYEDVTPLQPAPEEPSLTELTQRVLNGERVRERPFPHLPEMAGRFEEPVTPARRPIHDDQSPPPEIALWEESQPLDDDAEPVIEFLHTDAAGPEFTSSAPLARETGFPPPAAPLPEAPAKQKQRAKPRKPAKKQLSPEAVEAKLRRREIRREKARKSIGVLKKSARTVREKAVPMLMKGGLWLANNLRRREIRRRFNRLLVLGHTHLTDRKIERLFFVPTRKAEHINPAPDRGIHYDGPVQAKSFEWVMSLLPEDLREFAFIDIRAGRGRTSLLAAKYNFKQIVAYEYDEELFDDLLMNIAQYPRSRMTCRNIDAHRGDIDGITMPNQPCVIYFSNAWREPMIDGVINYVSDTYQKSPRRIYVILENIAAETALGGGKIFDPLEPPIAQRMKLRLLSPVDFRIYRSIA